MLLDVLRSSVFWELCIAGLIGFGGLWAWLLGVGRYTRRRALREQIAALGQVSTDSALAALTGMRRNIGDALLGLLGSSARPTSRSQLYRTPWILFVGDEAADVPGLLAAAHHTTAQPAPPARESMSDAFWRWWLLGPLVAIETHADAVCESSAVRERSLWLQALLELTVRRERLPLNGIVVCVSATTLWDDAAGIETTGRHLKRLVDETTQLLHLQLPVYLVVNGLEKLRGQQAVCGALAPDVLKQALGHRFAFNELDDSSGARFDTAFAAFMDRLHALRLALALNQASAAHHLAVHQFVDDVDALGPGLRLLVEQLFNHTDTAEPPASRWRGFYFTCAAEGGAPGAFVSDLFQQLLPDDQALARAST